jgi:hypothetical protein
MCVLELAPDATEAFAVVPLSVAVASFFATAVQALLSGIGAGFIIVCIMATYLANRNVCAGDSEHYNSRPYKLLSAHLGWRRGYFSLRRHFFLWLFSLGLLSSGHAERSAKARAAREGHQGLSGRQTPPRTLAVQSEPP